MLLFAGLQALGEESRGFPLALAVFEIVSSALLIGSTAIAFRNARRPVDHAHLPHIHHGGVDWMDIFAAGVLFAEVAEHWHLKHHIQRPTVLTAIVVLTVGLFHGRIARRAERRFTIRVGEDDLYVGEAVLLFRAKWAAIPSIDGPRDDQTAPDASEADPRIRGCEPRPPRRRGRAPSRDPTPVPLVERPPPRLSLGG